MTNETNGLLAGLSAELVSITERVGASVVRVDDGTRLTATGIIWSADGIIVTTSHGVERDEEVFIELHNGTRLAATLIGRDPDTDIAALRVAATGLPPAEVAADDAAKIGQFALALGRPGNSGLQATFGIVSARLDSQSEGGPETVLHTDAVFYPGFSGGPLVNVAGQVIGLNNLMFGRGKGVSLGVSIVRHVVEGLLAHGKMPRGYLGVRTQAAALPAHLIESLPLTQDRGLLIVQVEQKSPAEQGGLLLGDTLLSVSGQQITDVDSLRSQLRQHHAGQEIALNLLRGGVLLTLAVTLGTEN
ncbi:uncharacterized protein KY384_000090 [Bacidia gigantensis]|uniref:uncharacterized protein n=1 Tax=Bacidia gigantensis TaxID=2732470 RepID=UPI001D0436DD|nr:uncharacterized protein KY384_000090 [Bacidia gigantensis]KAG8526097.1 hypothetical protein KY384_000090 [Bacidia gigantensis]